MIKIRISIVATLLAINSSQAGEAVTSSKILNSDLQAQYYLVKGAVKKVDPAFNSSSTPYVELDRITFTSKAAMMLAILGTI